MLYCEKCRSVSQDSSAKCQNCKNPKLRAVNPEDQALLQRADQYTAGELCRRFDLKGIVYETEPFSKGRVSYLYDSEVMPTDKNIYVRWSDMEAAKEISAGLKLELDREQAEEGGGFQDMPQRKRIAVQIVSTLAFIVLVMLAVFGADALAGWLKGLLGMGS